MFAMGPAFFGSSGPALLALTGTFANAAIGVAYSSSIPISGGLEPYALTGGTGVASGALDSGFSLTITGTTGARFLTLSCSSPATADTMTFTASVDSSDGQTATSAQSVVISAGMIVPGLGVNVALNKSVSASAPVDAYTGAGNINAVTDGTTNSAAYVGVTVNGLQYMQVDLADVYKLDRVMVWHYWADGRKYHSNKTEVSSDGSNWTTIYDSAVNGEFSETSSGQTINFAARGVRYIRNSINGSTTNIANHWVEIQGSRNS